MFGNYEIERVWVQSDENEENRMYTVKWMGIEVRNTVESEEHLLKSLSISQLAELLKIGEAGGKKAKAAVPAPAPASKAKAKAATVPASKAKAEAKKRGESDEERKEREEDERICELRKKFIKLYSIKSPDKVVKVSVN